MNFARVIGATAVALWLGCAEGQGVETMIVARGAAELSVRSAEQPPAKCETRLESARVRHAAGIGEVELHVVRFTVTNRAAEPRTLTVVASLAPASTSLPALHALGFERHAFLVAGQPIVVADTPSRGAILADSPFGARALTPEETTHVASATGECRGEMIFDLMLAPGQTQSLGFFCPSPSATAPDATVSLDFLRALRIEEFFQR